MTPGICPQCGGPREKCVRVCDACLPHGERNTYRRGCRCAPCKKAHQDLVRQTTLRSGKHGYAKYKTGCRCNICSDAAANQWEKWNDLRAASPPPITEHGTRTSYRYGCRCRDCTDASNRYHLNWRRERGEALALVRKLEAEGVLT